MKTIMFVCCLMLLMLSSCTENDVVRDKITDKVENECLLKDETFFDSVSPNPIYYDDLGFFYPHPTEYKYNQIILAGFDASLQKVQNVMPSDKLIVIETDPGFTELLFLGMQGGTINDYETHEIWVAANVTHLDSGEEGLYIISLPISHYIGYKAGEVIFGFNKYAAEFEIEDIENKKYFTANIEGEVVTEFYTEMDKSECWINEETILFSYKDGAVLKNLMKVNWPRGKVVNSNGAGFTINEHDLNSDLLDLQISSTPNWHTYMADSQMILSEPEVLN